MLGSADRHVVVLDDVGRSHQDQEAQRRGSVFSIGRTEQTQGVRRSNLHDQDHPPDQRKAEGKGPSYVAVEEAGITRALGEQRESQQVRDDHQGGAKQKRSGEVGDVRR